MIDISLLSASTLVLGTIERASSAEGVRTSDDEVATAAMGGEGGRLTVSVGNELDPDDDE